MVMKQTHLLTECQDGLRQRIRVSGYAAMQDEPKARGDALIPWMLSFIIFLIGQVRSALSDWASPAVASWRNGRPLIRDAERAVEWTHL